MRYKRHRWPCCIQMMANAPLAGETGGVGRPGMPATNLVFPLVHLLFLVHCNQSRRSPLANTWVRRQVRENLSLEKEIKGNQRNKSSNLFLSNCGILNPLTIEWRATQDGYNGILERTHVAMQLCCSRPR